MIPYREIEYEISRKIILWWAVSGVASNFLSKILSRLPTSTNEDFENIMKSTRFHAISCYQFIFVSGLQRCPDCIVQVVVQLNPSCFEKHHYNNDIEEEEE